MNRILRQQLTALLCLCLSATFAQKPDTEIILPTKQIEKYYANITDKATDLEEKIDKKTAKALDRLKKFEDQLIGKIANTDSGLAATLANSQKSITELAENINNKTKKITDKVQGQYMPLFDSLKTSLGFLGKIDPLNSNLLGSTNALNELQTKLAGVQNITSYIKERKQQLKEAIAKLGNKEGIESLKNSYLKYSKEAYYYQAQIAEYKALLNEPDKLISKGLDWLREQPSFIDFFKKNSLIADLFHLPTNYGTPEALTGLQVRADVMRQLQSQISAGGPNAQAMFQQNLSEAQNQLNQLKAKVNEVGGSNSETEIPDFKPNDQKTKSFAKRLEYGLNFQSQQTQYIFPAITDIGLSIGYKLNDKSVIGIGASFKLGLGTGFNDIQFSTQGAGIRSYIDYKLKGSFFITGGYEQNYFSQAPGTNTSSTGTTTRPTADLYNGQAWRESGLIGITKKYQIGKRKASLQLLWDFLRPKQFEGSLPLQFRVGYNF
jgi:hypothetical protein